MFCRSLFVLLYLSFWSLCCLFFLDIRFLVAPLVSSNSSIRCPKQFNYKRQPQVFVAPRFGFLCCGFFLFCLSLSCVLSTQCYQCLWIVHSWLSLRFSLMFITIIVNEIFYSKTRISEYSRITSVWSLYFTTHTLF